jgi:uncharacterized integral membrane protein (TIGR00697 family)
MYKHLWFLMLSFSMVLVLANWFDARLVSLFGFVTDAGTLIFPITFLLSDLITEVYGFKQARRAIWCGFLFNLVFLLYGQLVIHLPNPDFQTNNAMFDALLDINARIIFASFISYLVSEPLNAYLLAKLKIRMHGHHMGLRFVLSTIIASAVDSMLFGSIAFYASMSHSHLIALITTMWVIKVIIEIIGLPISIRLANKLKRLEKLDIYDAHTNFSLFALNANYTAKDNQFQQ